MQSSSLRRQMKNMVNQYTEAEVKVREATSNDHWGPPSGLMAEISDLTYNVVTFAEVMGIIWKRLNDHGKNWRHVYKALTLLDFLVKTGSERVPKACRDNIYAIQTLKDFQYLDRDGRDQGINVREKAKQLVSLLKDEERLKRERTHALKNKSRAGGVVSSSSSSGGGSSFSEYASSSYTSRHTDDEFSRCRSSPSSSFTTPSSRLAPDLEQAIPSSSGEEELQLQLALAMSREESEKPPPTVDIDEHAQLQMAMNLSKKETHKSKPVKRPPAATVDMDEDAQLQLALSLSKEEHQQEQLSRRGDETQLQQALEESKREMQGKGGTAFMDLVDVFAVPADGPPIDNRWNNPSHQAPAGARGTDPWDSLDNNPRPDSPWMVPPPSNTPPPPWEPPVNPWAAPPNNVSNLKPTGRDFAFPGNPGADLFSTPSERTASRGAFSDPQLRSGSPSDGDLFDEAMDGGHPSINGRGVDSPDLFELSGLRESLVNPTPRLCQTPEAFLGPTAASLVNLDTLITANPQTMTTNPFLAGPSAPPTSNPFQTEQPKRSLNQMGTTSAAPLASSLPYSASLPLPTTHQEATISMSFTHPTQPGLDLPRKLPEPLLPFSSPSNQESQDVESNQNPFL